MPCILAPVSFKCVLDLSYISNITCIQILTVWTLLHSLSPPFIFASPCSPILSHWMNLDPCGGLNNVDDGCGMVFPHRTSAGCHYCPLCKKLKVPGLSEEAKAEIKVLNSLSFLHCAKGKSGDHSTMLWLWPLWYHNCWSLWDLQTERYRCGVHTTYSTFDLAFTTLLMNGPSSM